MIGDNILVDIENMNELESTRLDTPTDEIIIHGKYVYNTLLITTESGIVWVSFDKGKTFRLQEELIAEAQQEYFDKLTDIRIDYERRLADLARERHLRLKKLAYPND